MILYILDNLVLNISKKIGIDKGKIEKGLIWRENLI